MHPIRFQTRKGNTSLAGRFVGLLGVALVVLLVWLSADPEAHEHFHHDAGGDEHHCVVTDFAVGEAYFLAPEIVVRPNETVYQSIQSRAIEALRKPTDFVLLPSCGPPV